LFWLFNYWLMHTIEHLIVWYNLWMVLNMGFDLSDFLCRWFIDAGFLLFLEFLVL
jgi:hypothetical protein